MNRMRDIQAAIVEVLGAFRGKDNTVTLRREMQQAINGNTARMLPYSDEEGRKVVGFQVCFNPAKPQVPVVRPLFQLTAVLAFTQREFIEWCEGLDIHPKNPHWVYIGDEKAARLQRAIDHIEILPRFTLRPDAKELLAITERRRRPKPYQGLVH